MKKKLALICCASLLLTALYGCSAGVGSQLTAEAPQAAPAPPSNYAADYGMGEAEIAYDDGPTAIYDAVAPADPEADASAIAPPQSEAVMQNANERKIVYTADLSLQTKEFETGIAVLEEMTTRYEGFIQSTRLNGHNLFDYSGRPGARSAYYTVRIPESGMQAFMSELEEHFNVNSSYIYSDDITAAYFDTQARLDSLKIQQTRLREMLNKAEDVEYLLKVERELARVVYEIESLTSTINRMNDAINFSTLNLSLEEVLDYTLTQPINAPFGEQLSGAFSGSWKGFVLFCQDFVLGLVSMTPFIIMVLLVVALIVISVRKRRAKKRAKQATNQPQDDTQLPQ